MALEDLTEKQQLFVLYYTGAANWNATRAAKMAGYSPDTAYNIGWENVRKPEIAKAIKDRITEIAMSSEEVLLRMAGHARSSVDDVIDEETEAVDLKRARRTGAIDFIREYSCKRVQTDPEYDGPVTVHEQKIKLVDSQAALVQLGKHHKLWTDKLEATGRDGEELFKVYNAIDPEKV